MPTSGRRRSALEQTPVYRYGFGFLITVGFLLLARTLYFAVNYNPLILILTAIIVVSWSFGRGPGLMTALVSAFGVRLLFFPKAPYRFDLSDLGRLLFYLATTGVVSYLVGARRRAEDALLRANADLERRVEERTRQLQATNDELRRANSDLEQFAYSASHDLLEPLRMVSIHLQMIQQQYGAQLEPRAHEYMSRAIGGAKRMGSLINGLQAYLTISAVESRLEPVDAGAVVAGCLELLEVAMVESGARVEFEGLPAVPFHEVHLQLVFQNLIANAIRYRSELPPHIRIGAARVEGEWRFSVSDNGVGIDPRYTSQIFGVFKRLQRYDESDGIGMGLAICKKIVERYGGRIWAESLPGKGSTFFFTVPAGEMA